MVFRLLGGSVRVLWPLWLAGWVGLLLATDHAAPPWDSVARDKEFGFLPEDSPSRRAEEVYAKAFPEYRSASNVVLVLARAADDPRARDRDMQFIDRYVEPGLRQIAESEGGLADQPAPSDEPLFSADEKPAPTRSAAVARVRTPSSPAGGALLISPDGRALLVVVELTSEFLSNANWPTITKIENLVRDLRQQGKVPDGLDLAVTGSAVVGRDHTLAQRQSVHATQLLTIVLVIGLLVAIYRAPLLAIIPLVTVYLAVRISINFLALLGGAGHLVLFEGIEIYITILAYGAGVDYCLFLTARYKEELGRGGRPADAVAAAVENVGHAVVASAAAVMCGIGTMAFARFGKFHEAGLAIPLSLGVVLAATMTFSPSLLRLAGRWAFWPQRIEGKAPAAVPPPEPGGSSVRPGGLEGFWDRVGQVLLRRPGTVWLVTVALMAPFAIVAGVFYNHLSYDLIGELPADTPGVGGTRVLQEHFPAGVVGPSTVLVVDPALNFASDGGRAVVARVTDRLHAREQELGLADVRSLTAPVGVARGPDAKLFTGMNLPEETVREATRQGSLAYYVTDLGERAKIGTRLELIFDQSPFARASIANLDRVEEAVREALGPDAGPSARLYVTGTTASVRDLATVIRQDRNRIQLLVLVSVFVVLVLLLRGLATPAYLMLSVLFSYFAALGVAFVVFWLLDPHGFAGIDWKVAIFLFTILIAVGADYNIFLMTRIHEEEVRHGPILGITQALDRTGPIISSCGIIMAGTFASLLGASLTDIKQLGFALAFGVLLDTFVVRPVLVPAFLILYRSGRLSPAGWSRARPRTSAESPPPAPR
jgi:RND superfamily putative drug exporter